MVLIIYVNKIIRVFYWYYWYLYWKLQALVVVFIALGYDDFVSKLYEMQNLDNR